MVRLCLVIDSFLTLKAHLIPEGFSSVKGVQGSWVAILVDYEQSLFFLCPSHKRPRHANDHARDWSLETRLPPSFLAFRGFAAQRSRARALPLLNLKKKRGCSQSTVLAHAWRHFVQRKNWREAQVSHCCYFSIICNGVPTVIGQ